MLTRYAIFEGHLLDGQEDAFRAAVINDLVPMWRQFPGQTALRITFGLERDEGAPEYPLILAITYPDRPTMEAALEHPIRLSSRAATQAAIAGRFEGKIHHHVTEMLDFPA